METANRTVTDLSDVVAKEIRVLLLRRDMKQTELAAKMGVSEMWLSRRLRGAQPLDLNDLRRIAEVLNVEPGDLLPRSNEGRVVTAASGGSATNQRSGHEAGRLRHGSSRMTTKRHAAPAHPIGRPETGTATPTPAGPPTQRRAALIAHRPGN